MHDKLKRDATRLDPKLLNLLGLSGLPTVDEQIAEERQRIHATMQRALDAQPNDIRIEIPLSRFNIDTNNDPLKVLTIDDECRDWAKTKEFTAVLFDSEGNERIVVSRNKDDVELLQESIDILSSPKLTE